MFTVPLTMREPLPHAHDDAEESVTSEFSERTSMNEPITSGRW
jgi:hypothetical protein